MIKPDGADPMAVGEDLKSFGLAEKSGRGQPQSKTLRADECS